MNILKKISQNYLLKIVDENDMSFLTIKIQLELNALLNLLLKTLAFQDRISSS